MVLKMTNEMFPEGTINLFLCRFQILSTLANKSFANSEQNYTVLALFNLVQCFCINYSTTHNKNIGCDYNLLSKFKFCLNKEQTTYISYFTEFQNNIQFQFSLVVNDKYRMKVVVIQIGSRGNVIAVSEKLRIISCMIINVF